MKKLLFLLLFLPLFLCGDCSGDQQTFPEDLEFPVNDSQLPSDTVDTQKEQSVELQNTSSGGQRIILYLPAIENGPHIGKLTLTVLLAADTVQSYTINASSAREQPKAPSKSSDDVIKPGDTRFKIAERKGVPIREVLNREPLKVGEKIHLKQ